jgi:plastocyanin
MKDKHPTLESVRIIPRDAEFLNRKIGARGEVYFDQAEKTLRLYDGIMPGGISLLRADLSNIEGQISSVIISSTAPSGVDEGTIWFNSVSGKLYIYYNDGNSFQWVQPTSSGGSSGGGATSLTGLTDVSISSLASGQVLKYNGTAWVNGTDNTGGGGGGGATTLDELTDVVISTPSSGQYITFNGTTWVNSSLSVVTSLTAGTGISLTGSTGNISISSTSTTTYAGLTDATAAGTTVDQFYLPAITKLVVSNSGVSAWLFDQYTGTNPTVYAINGTTIAFKLTSTGHSFRIQDPTGTDYNTGLIHVSSTGVVSQGSMAQGKNSGTLYWKIPADISGNYRYQCTDHIGMVGSIVIKNFLAL